MLQEQYVELAELAGGFIHEIKNHLSTLGLNLQLLAEDFQEPETPRERRALDRVLRLQNESQRLINVSNDFLRFARTLSQPLSQPLSHPVAPALTSLYVESRVSCTSYGCVSGAIGRSSSGRSRPVESVGRRARRRGESEQLPGH